MFSILLFSHSLVRWFVVASLLFALYRAFKGYFSKSSFSKIDNATRHWTATIAHVQLMIGVILYFKSPIVCYFSMNYNDAIKNSEVVFFSLMHSLMMFLSIVLITIGSAKSKRSASDNEKFKTMIRWYLLAFIIILIAIPWPFSPFANRPYLR